MTSPVAYAIVISQSAIHGLPNSASVIHSRNRFDRSCRIQTRSRAETRSWTKSLSARKAKFLPGLDDSLGGRLLRERNDNRMTSGTEPSTKLSPEAFRKLRAVSTATLTTQLLNRGFKNTFLQGLSPVDPDSRMVGYAFTLRFVPAREDFADTMYDNTQNVQRIAVETIDKDQVMVIDARGDIRAASFGHILGTRIKMRGAAGLVTDGSAPRHPRIQRTGPTNLHSRAPRHHVLRHPSPAGDERAHRLCRRTRDARRCYGRRR